VTLLLLPLLLVSLVTPLLLALQLLTPLQGADIQSVHQRMGQQQQIQMQQNNPQQQQQQQEQRLMAGVWALPLSAVGRLLVVFGCACLLKSTGASVGTTHGVSWQHPMR
jgi:hypothetical protein